VGIRHADHVSAKVGSDFADERRPVQFARGLKRTEFVCQPFNTAVTLLLCRQGRNREPGEVTPLALAAHSFAEASGPKTSKFGRATCGQAVYPAVHIAQYKCSWDFAPGSEAPRQQSFSSSSCGAACSSGCTFLEGSVFSFDFISYT
jgi:hypothetical protein